MDLCDSLWAFFWVLFFFLGFLLDLSSRVQSRHNQALQADGHALVYLERTLQADKVRATVRQRALIFEDSMNGLELV